MYVESDFLLALIKDEDWLEDAAETVYRKYQDKLWTSQLTLVELLVVSYREGRDTERVITNAANLVEVRGDADTVITATTYIGDYGFTPFDALHLVESGEDKIVSSDTAYDDFSPRLDLTDIESDE